MGASANRRALAGVRPAATYAQVAEFEIAARGLQPLLTIALRTR
jgi:hypothetical protein